MYCVKILQMANTKLAEAKEDWGKTPSDTETETVPECIFYPKYLNVPVKQKHFVISF